jgi:P-type Cu2+ transporter
MTAIPAVPLSLPATAADACGHCGSPLASATDRYCCVGCEAAHGLIQGLGLGQFYRRRLAVANNRPLKPDSQPAPDFAAYVKADERGRPTLYLMVDGVSCGACVWLVESVLAQDPDVIAARMNLGTRRLTLSWDGPADDAARHIARLTALGFRLVPFDPQHLEAQADAGERSLLRALAVAGFAASNVMLLSIAVWSGHVDGMGAATRDFLHWVSALIALPAIAYAGQPFFRSALAALRAGRTNMDVPISIGVSLAAAMSLAETVTSGQHAFFDSAITLLFFLLVGRYLDTRARGQARSAAVHLLSLGAKPTTVVRPDGSVCALPASAVRVGDTVMVATGERVSVDGRVLDGRSDIDTSFVTGEAVPQAVGPGASVFAGAVNLTAPLRLTVEATGDGTLLAEIVRLMEVAEQRRGRFVVLADRVARAYAPVVHLLAAITFIGWFGFAGVGWQPALLNAIAVLIITCPCALALAVPVVQVVVSNRLLRQGILLKSATALERLTAIDTVVFDKTGTLTTGQLTLIPDPARPAESLALAASMAQVSRHPLARALVHAMPDAEAAHKAVEHPGQGLSLASTYGEIRLGSRTFCGLSDHSPDCAPELWLAIPGRSPIRFSFSDALRPDAATVIETLQKRGLQVQLLSGDRQAAVAHVAGRLGIPDWQASCTPASKEQHLSALRAAGRHVLMVGDGLNDAPALATADVSLSPSSAADVSLTAADAVFQGDRLAPVLELLTVARRADRLVRQNIAIAIAYNLLAVPLAMAGLVTPLIAAVAMSSSSLLVIGNAMRLSRGRR